MKRIIIIILLFATTICCIFNFDIEKNLEENAKLELINNSNKKIQEIFIQYEKGNISYTQLKINKRVIFPIYMSSAEGSYRIRVEFADKKLKTLNDFGYIEIGDYIVLKIFKNKIMKE